MEDPPAKRKKMTWTWKADYAYKFVMQKGWFDKPAEARDLALRIREAHRDATRSQLEARLVDLENAYEMATKLGLAKGAKSIEWAERFIMDNPGVTPEQRAAIIKAYEESIPSRTPAEARKRAVDSMVLGECPLCLEKMRRGDPKLRWLSCAHVFHTACLEPWRIQNNGTCPNCRRRLD